MNSNGSLWDPILFKGSKYLSKIFPGNCIIFFPKFHTKQGIFPQIPSRITVRILSGISSWCSTGFLVRSFTLINCRLPSGFLQEDFLGCPRPRVTFIFSPKVVPTTCLRSSRKNFMNSSWVLWSNFSRFRNHLWEISCKDSPHCTSLGFSRYSPEFL